jgi:hypothetical protein
MNPLPFDHSEFFSQLSKQPDIKKHWWSKLPKKRWIPGVGETIWVHIPSASIFIKTEMIGIDTIKMEITLKSRVSIEFQRYDNIGPCGVKFIGSGEILYLSPHIDDYKHSTWGFDNWWIQVGANEKKLIDNASKIH